jgi:hypothetical protein
LNNRGNKLNSFAIARELPSDVVFHLIWKGKPAASAYKLQFFGLTESSFYKIIWKAWGTPKAKNHVCLALQNRLWTAIGSGGEDGKIAGFALFASKRKKTTTTFLCIAVSPFGFGSYSRSGLESKRCIQDNGRV